MSKGNISKDGKWMNLGGDLHKYISAETIHAKKSFRHLRIPSLSHSFGNLSEREARRKLPEIIEAWKKYHLTGEESSVAIRFGKGKTISEVCDEFEHYELPKRERARTRENIRNNLRDMRGAFGKIQVGSFSEEIYFDRLETFKQKKARDAEKRRKEKKGGTERKTFDYLAVQTNTVMRYALKKKYIRFPLKIPFTDPKARAGRAITHEEAKSLYATMNDDSRDIYALCYGSCMRRNEALLLEWDRFELKTGLLTLRPEDVKTGSRTGKGRQFFVAAWVLDRLRARWLRQKHLGSPWVFPSPINPKEPQRTVKTAWRLAKRRVGIKGRLRWHDLRHSGISYLLLEKGVDPIKVSEFVGTSLRTIQKVYLHSRAEHTRGVGEALNIFE